MTSSLFEGGERVIKLKEKLVVKYVFDAFITQTFLIMCSNRSMEVKLPDL